MHVCLPECRVSCVPIHPNQISPAPIGHYRRGHDGPHDEGQRRGISDLRTTGRPAAAPVPGDCGSDGRVVVDGVCVEWVGRGEGRVDVQLEARLVAEGTHTAARLVEQLKTAVVAAEVDVSADHLPQRNHTHIRQIRLHRHHTTEMPSTRTQTTHERMREGERQLTAVCVFECFVPSVYVCSRSEVGSLRVTAHFLYEVDFSAAVLSSRLNRCLAARGLQTIIAFDAQLDRPLLLKAIWLVDTQQWTEVANALKVARQRGYCQLPITLSVADCERHDSKQVGR